MLVTIAVTTTALVASILAAVAGFGGAVIMLPVLVWAVGIRDAIPILTIAQLIGNLSRVVFNKGELKWRVVWRFALGAVPAAVIGGIIFAAAPAAVIMHITKLGVYGSYALVGVRTLQIGLAIGVVMILGTYLGKRLLDRVPERVFPYIIEGTMLIAGLLFIIRG